MVTCKHIIGHKYSVLDRNAWYPITVGKLFLFEIFNPI